jgi:hypothetical protein
MCSRATICVRYWGCWWPPRVPSSIRRAPPLVHRVGASVWSGRLPGAASFGSPARSEKPAPRLCSQIPVSPAGMPLPIPVKLDWINETPIPTSSTTQR